MALGRLKYFNYQLDWDDIRSQLKDMMQAYYDSGNNDELLSAMSESRAKFYRKLCIDQKILHPGLELNVNDLTVAI